MSERELERLVGAVLLPEVRPGGFRPDDATLERFPPVGLVAFRGLVPGAGPAEELLAEVRARCAELGGRTPFACADLEEGAGLHLRAATRLPPAMALAAAAAGAAARGEDEAAPLREAGRLTAAEARAHGVELVLAPVVDVNTRAGNPIIAVRSFGDRGADVARRARAFLDGLHAGGAGGCLKHFPGHGDTREDSHLELARVDRPLEQLWAEDLAPYRALADADAVMVGHLRVEALGEPGGADADQPTSLRRDVATGLLRGALGYRGALLTDALDMGGVARAPDRFARAVDAGCEGLLCMADHRAAAEELLDAVRSGRLDEHRLVHAARAMEELARRLAQRRPAPPPGDAAARARELARVSLLRLPGASSTAADAWPWPRGADAEVRAAPGAEPVAESLRVALAGAAGGGSSADAADPARGATAGAGGTVGAGGAAAGPAARPAVVAAAGEVRAWRGRAGLDDEARAGLVRELAGLREAGRPRALVWFASPQLLPPELGDDPALAVLVAFAPSPPMVGAVADFLRGACAAPGGAPVGPRRAAPAGNG